ncbi:MAG: asparaginase [Muribaculaceae bacterium]|nr:asparaginase [Muribaculaceae bacterium]
MTTKQRPRLLIIYTGGTIGMIENPSTHALQPFDFSHLIDNVPKVKMLGYDIDNIQFDPPIDSANMNPQHWSDIAQAIEDNYARYDGFVVLHGTDTMAFTASALSFMLENLRKPVIITGSQLPIGEVRTDGEENLITALQVAAAITADGEPTVQEVAILFNDSLWRGNRSTKMSADNFDAFKSYNYPELARIGLDITFRDEYLYRAPADEPLRVRRQMDTNVMYLELYPGITRSTLHHQLHTPGIRGIVLKTFGAGNAPTEPWFIQLISDAVARGIVVLNVTQCATGGVNDTLYETGNTLTAAGVVSGHDITREAAITKLMFLFGQGLDTEAVKQQLHRSLCGEITMRRK